MHYPISNMGVYFSGTPLPSPPHAPLPLGPGCGGPSMGWGGVFGVYGYIAILDLGYWIYVYIYSCIEE